MKRIKLKVKKPNPLFELWLEEWREEAASKNSDLQKQFSKALTSLRKYPLPLKSGRDCIILQHFGTKLCLMLDRKLEEYKARTKGSTSTSTNDIDCNAGEQLGGKFESERNVLLDTTDEEADNSEEPFRLYKSNSAELITDKCFEQQPVVRDRDRKGQNSKQNVAGKLRERTKSAKNLDPHIEDNDEMDSLDTFKRNAYFKTNKFDIILLVDTQEICGGKTKPENDATIVELTELGVSFEVRHLKVGDFAWIARCRNTNRELVLPYVVERKRIDDLSASITDGRFHEQKFRLKQSGIQNLMYVIEEYEKGRRLAIPHSSLMQASINTLIQDGFSVKYTRSHKDSMFYLSSLSRILITIFKEKNLSVCKKEDIAQIDILNDNFSMMEFEEFNKAASKQKVFKVNEMFVRHLLQLKGMSIEKAAAIVDRYPSPRALIEAFRRKSSDAGLLLATIDFGDKKRLIGPAISQTIHQLYTKRKFD
ncbi:crossover junction endonuclease MUS81 [Ceratina calcarata]|uniref:Crossover junction endonuclease MUS81 n=1 Tax=Ceratina calcarata TaxID=156304 RepID=A0AAJ7WFH5_9HYME|nr:crossover junction endonuclease MUS81 [Ceratina calcarata]XP_026674529.1 crossover junction endonuclease MUS81 [Ceratina calcarata]